jgi:hypothetical protein
MRAAALLRNARPNSPAGNRAMGNGPLEAQAPGPGGPAHRPMNLPRTPDLEGTGTRQHRLSGGTALDWALPLRLQLWKGERCDKRR